MAKLHSLPAGLAALSLAACGMAGAASMTGGSPAFAAAEPLACALVVREAGGMVAIEARLRAAVATAGDYALRLQSGGGATSINQGGGFAVAAGEEIVLGAATLSGRARDLAADFSVTAAGQRIDCPVAAEF